jgi:hypothetical protein
MGGVGAGLDFGEIVGGKTGGGAASELGQAFALLQGSPHRGGERFPLPSFEGFGLFGGFLGGGLFPALGFDLETGGVLFAATQFDGALAEAAQGADLDEGLVVQGGAWGRENGGETEADGLGEMVGDGLAGDDGFEFLAVGGQIASQGEEVLMGEPLLKAALAPFAEVLLADGAAGEICGEDGFDFGQ